MSNSILLGPKNFGIGHVNNIPTMQSFTGISRNTQSKSYMLSLTECIWEFWNNALWDTDRQALLKTTVCENRALNAVNLQYKKLVDLLPGPGIATSINNGDINNRVEIIQNPGARPFPAGF